MPDRKLIVVVEDELSERVCRKVVAIVAPNTQIDRVVVARGNGNIRAKIATYERASRFIKHLVLTDLDRIPCPLHLLRNWRISPQTQLMFRVAVREVEAWLMADRIGFSDHFGVPYGKLQNEVELDIDPKSTLLALIKKSRVALTRGMNPDSGSLSKIGPMYNQRLADFVSNVWNVRGAAAVSPSLNRMIIRLAEYDAIT